MKFTHRILNSTEPLIMGGDFKEGAYVSIVRELQGDLVEITDGRYHQVCDKSQISKITDPDKKLFLVYTTDTESSGSYKYIADSFEEVQEHLSEFADYCAPAGSCTVDMVDKYFKVRQTWRYFKGILCRS